MPPPPQIFYLNTFYDSLASFFLDGTLLLCCTLSLFLPDFYPSFLQRTVDAWEIKELVVKAEHEAISPSTCK